VEGIQRIVCGVTETTTCQVCISYEVCHHSIMLCFKFVYTHTHTHTHIYICMYTHTYVI